MTDDLIARLRSFDVSWSQTGEWCAEAADRIEELETEARENARIIGMSAEREMALRGEVEQLRVIDIGQRECAAKVFAYLIARSQEPEEFLPGSYVKRLHADERTAWLKKMQKEYNEGNA